MTQPNFQNTGHTEHKHIIRPASLQQLDAFLPPDGLSSLPMAHGQALYFGGLDGSLYTLDLSTRRRSCIDPQPDNTPITSLTTCDATTQLTLLCSTQHGSLRAYAPKSAALLWNHQGPHTSFLSAVYDEERAYFVGHDGSIIALDHADGAVLWQRKHAPTLAPPALAQERLYTHHRDGMLQATSCTSGQPLWQRQLPAALHSAPVYTDTAILSACTDGSLYALDPADGRVLWTYHAGGPLILTPAVDAYDTIYLCGHGGIVHAVDLRTGRSHWQHRFGHRLLCQPCSAGGLLVFLDASGMLTALDRNNTKHWTRHCNFPLRQPTRLLLTQDQLLLGAKNIIVQLPQKAAPRKATPQATQAQAPTAPQALQHTKAPQRSMPQTASGAASPLTPALQKARSQFRGNAHNNGMFASHTAARGGMHWRSHPGGFVDSSPVAADNRLFLATLSGKLHELDLHTGTHTRSISVDKPIHTTPAIAQGRIVFGCDDGSLYCYDLQTQELQWERSFDHALRASPTINLDTVYIGTWDHSFCAFSLKDGIMKWDRSFAYGISSSAAVARGKVFFGDWGGNMRALDAHTGTSLWNYKADGPICSSPAYAKPEYDRGMLAFGCGNNVIILEEDGKHRRTFETQGTVNSSPAIHEGIVYATSEDNHLYAFDPDSRTGKTLWHFKAAGSQGIIASPVICDKTVFFGTKDNSLYAVDAQSGALRWHWQGVVSFLGSPLIHQGSIFCADYHGMLYAFGTLGPDAQDTLPPPPPTEETPAYDIQTLRAPKEAANALGDPQHRSQYTSSPFHDQASALWNQHLQNDPLQTTPCAADGTVFVGRQDGTLEARDTRNGSIRWSFDAKGPITQAPSVGTLVYVTTANGHLYALLRSSGKIQWQWHNDTSLPLSSPVLHTDEVIVCSQDILYGFDQLTGKQRWHNHTGGVISHNTPSIHFDGQDALPLPVITTQRGFLQLSSPGYREPSYRSAWQWQGHYYDTDEPCPIENLATTTAAIDDDIACFGDQNGEFYAVRMNGARLVWKFQADGPIHAPPAIYNASVYVCSADGHLYCLGLYDGFLYWKVHVGGALMHAPCIADGAVFVGCYDGRVYAFDQQRGEPLSQSNLHSAVTTGLLLAERSIFCGTADGQLHAIHMRPGPGTPLSAGAPPPTPASWRYTAPQKLTPATLHEDQLYLGGQDQLLHVLHAQTGQRLWAFHAKSPILAAPTARYREVYFGGQDGTFFSLDTHTQQVRWQWETEGPIHIPATVAHDLVIFGSKDGYLYAMTRSDGRIRWRRYLLNPDHVQPILAFEETLFLADGANLHAIDLQSGSILWEKALPDRICPMTRAGRTLFVSTRGGHLHALRTSTGESEWTFRAAAFEHSLTFDDEHVYVGNCNHNLYALDRFSGEEQWRFTANASITSAPFLHESNIPDDPLDESVCFGCKDGRFYALSTQTRKAVASFQHTHASMQDLTFSTKHRMLYLHSPHTLHAIDLHKLDNQTLP